MIRSFLDSGVLLAAARLDQNAAESEWVGSILDSSHRTFLTSPFVALEIVPKAVFYKRRYEQAFYERFLLAAVWNRDFAQIEDLARKESASKGLAAMDALHVAAASLLQADEFITTERPGRSIYRSSLVKILYLFDNLQR